MRDYIFSAFAALLLTLAACGGNEAPEPTPEPGIGDSVIVAPIPDPEPEKPGNAAPDTTPSGNPVPAADECVPSLDIEMTGSTATVAFSDCPHPGPRQNLVAGWGYAQINVQAMRGSMEAEIERAGAKETVIEKNVSRFFSVLAYPDHPSLLASGSNGEASVTEFSLELSSDADVRVHAYPSNGECILDARIVNGEAEVVESGRLWRWVDPDERHFCTKPDEVL